MLNNAYLCELILVNCPLGNKKLFAPLAEMSGKRLRVTTNASAPDLNPSYVVIELFTCSTTLIMKFILLINVKMPTVGGIFTFIS